MYSNSGKNKKSSKLTAYNKGGGAVSYESLDYLVKHEREQNKIFRKRLKFLKNINYEIDGLNILKKQVKMPQISLSNPKLYLNSSKKIKKLRTTDGFDNGGYFISIKRKIKKIII
jgi:hypothetical protein